MCEEKGSSSSEDFPVRIFTTPAGTSEEFKTSANVTEQRGFVSEARTTEVFPLAMAGAIAETNPIKEFSSGAMMETTPVGSGTEKLKCEDETGFTEEKICEYLSHHPE